MTREEDVRDLEASVLRGFGIGGRLEQVRVGEGFLDAGLVISEDARDESDDRVGNDGRGDSSIGEDIVSDAELFIHQCLDDAEVYSLVVPTDEDEVLVCRRETLGVGLLERLPLGSHQDDVGIRGTKVIDGLEDRFRLEDEPHSTAVRVVVTLLVIPLGPVTELVSLDIDDAVILSAFDDALVQRSESDVGEEGEDIDLH